MPCKDQILGTIISSVLNYDQLCKAIPENPAFNAASSSYAPCDGRSIDNSALATILNVQEPKALDLRGKFLRGLNLFYNPGEFDFDLSSSNPEDKDRKWSVGHYQQDMLSQHNHTVSGSILNCGAAPGYPVLNNTPAPTLSQSTSPTGGDETRPKNVSVYYYIKIN